MRISGGIMNKKRSGMNEFLSEFHSTCKSIIFDGLGIKKMNNSDLFISGWYAAAISLAYSIRMLRTDIDLISVFIFIMTIILLLLLSVNGLVHGHFNNKIPGIKKKKNVRKKYEK